MAEINLASLFEVKEDSNLDEHDLEDEHGLEDEYDAWALASLFDEAGDLEYDAWAIANLFDPARPARLTPFEREVDRLASSSLTQEAAAAAWRRHRRRAAATAPAARAARRAMREFVAAFAGLSFAQAGRPPRSDDKPAPWRVNADGALEVSADARHVVVRGCAALKSIPRDLRQLTGVLRLEGCQALEALPSGLRCGGSLVISRCEKLQALPADLAVAKTLKVERCHAIAAVNGGVSCRKLDLRKCHGLRRVSGRVEAEEVVLDGLHNLEEMDGEQVNVQGELVVRKCSALGELPRARCGSLAVRRCAFLHCAKGAAGSLGDVLLERCQRVQLMPRKVNGTLTLRSCRGLYSLGPLGVGGNLTVEKCSDLIKVAAKVIGAAELSTLPALRHVDVAAASLGVARCDRLRKLRLPLGDLRSLRVSRCRKLESIASRRYRQVSVQCGMELDDLPQLEECAPNASALVVGGDFALHKVPLLGRLPPLSLPPLPRGASCKLHLVGVQPRLVQLLDLESCCSGRKIRVGLAPPTRANAEAEEKEEEDGNMALAKLILAGAKAGVEVQVEGEVEDFEPTSDQDREDEFALLSGCERVGSIAVALAMWSVRAGRSIKAAELGRQAAAASALAKHERRSLRIFLSKLHGAVEFKGDARQQLALRVCCAMDFLLGEHRDPDAGRSMLQRMADSVDACHDKPIWALNQMSLTAQLASARDDREALRKLGQGVMRLQVVHAKAAEHIAADNDDPDDVSVYLSMEVALREELELPVAATALHFPESCTEAIDEARKEALSLSQADLEAWLAQWAPWQRLMRAERAERVRARVRESDTPGRRLQRLAEGRLDLVGEPMADPVAVGGGVWSLEDVLRHWVDSGRDLVGATLEEDTVEELRLLEAAPGPPAADGQEADKQSYAAAAKCEEPQEEREA